MESRQGYERFGAPGSRYQSVSPAAKGSRSLLLSVLTRPFKHLRTKLLVSMLAVVFLLTASVLVLVQARMGKQIRSELASTLRMESRVYAEIERARREQSQQSAALIANQASLKALMSTDDALTVQDGSQTILPTSHADLLILENTSGKILALHAKSKEVTPAIASPLMKSSTSENDSDSVDVLVEKIVEIAEEVLDSERVLLFSFTATEFFAAAVTTTFAFCFFLLLFEARVVMLRLQVIVKLRLVLVVAVVR